MNEVQLSLEAEGMPVPEQRFNPDQRRAFGSVPGLLGKDMSIPTFNHLNAQAVEAVEPEHFRRGLLGPNDRYAVDTVVLNVAEYSAIVRNPEKFQDAVQAKTVAASRAANAIRATEKELKSGRDSFRQKWKRQRAVMVGLQTEIETLDTLLEWQRVPGFSRTSQIDIVDLAGRAWNGTIANMLKTYKDQHQLTPKQYADMSDALAYRLFRGPQTQRVENWGNVLYLAREYTGAKLQLFQRRQNKITRFGIQLANDLDNFYNKHGIFEVK